METNVTIHFTLLGPSLNSRFTAVVDGTDARSFSISSRKGRAILAYLAMQPKYYAGRDQLATLLWGDRFDDLARQNLRQCLATLRKELAAVAPDVLSAERDGVGLRKHSLLVDAVEFVALADSPELSMMERAVDLYRGEFLAGMSIEAEAFRDWVEGERSRLRAIAARILESYAKRVDALGNGQKAIDAGARLVALDPLREDWQRLLLRLYARYEGRDSAMAHARALTAILRKELDVDPSLATTTLVADIDRGAITQVFPITAPPDPAAARSPAGESQAQLPFPSVLTAKPSLVVLPFADMSPRSDLDRFADGLAIDVIAALSCAKSLSVVAGNSSFAYKHRTTESDQIFRELGIGYVLRGCVRSMNNRVRIAAQLVDACTGDHIWARRYDRELHDVFEVQDEIASNIAASVEPHIYAAEGIRASRQPPHTLDARGCVMRAISLINIRSKRNYACAEDLLKRAIELDPACAQAYSLFAYVMALEVVYGWKPRENTIVAARNAADSAILLDVDAPWSHFALGYVHAQSRSAEEAIRAYEKALALNPSFGLAHTYLASALSVLGRSEAALAQIDVAERLSSREIFHGVNNYVRANAHFAAGRHREASLFARNSVRESPGIVTSQRHLVVNCALVGAVREAKTALEDLQRLVPGTSLRSIDEALPYVREQDRSLFLDAFYSVGIE